MKTHGNENSFKCSSCNYSSHESSKVEIHARSHTGEKPNKCNVCEHSSNYSLNIHMRTHSRGKPFKCGQCDYASSQKGNLSNHITNKHTGIRSIKCNVCDFASSYKSSLKLHMKLHLTENPYKCNQCTFSTLWMDCLKRHIKRKHAFDKQIICCQAEQLLNCSMSKRINTSIHIQSSSMLTQITWFLGTFSASLFFELTFIQSGKNRL